MATPGHMPQKLGALFTTAVWGAEYVDRFLNYSLRTQISDGNLGAFDSNSLFLLVTDAKSIKRIRTSSIHKTLSDLIRVEYVDIESIGTTSDNKYSLLTACQNYALSRAIEFDALFFGYGDALWADGSYLAAARRLAEGYDAVFSFGYPVLDVPFKAVVDKMADGARAQAIAIAPRAFAQHVYRHLHPMAHANRWKSEWMTHCPSYLVWNIPEQGLLLRAFHLHPVAFRVRRDSPYFFTPFRTTLDEEFVARLNRTNPRIYICPNSDELGVCSLAEETNLSYRMEPPRPVSIGDLANFAETYAGLVHRQLFSRSIRLTIDDVIESRWQPSEDEAAAIDSEVRQRLSIPDSVLALENPDAFSARLQRQINYRHWYDSKSISVGVERSIAATTTRDFSNRNLGKVADPAAAKIEAIGRIMATNSSAENFSKMFRTATVGAGSVTVSAKLRRSLLRMLYGLTRALHAIGVTRAVRIFVLPILPEMVRLHVYRIAYRLGVIVSATANTAPSRRHRRRGRFFRWVKQTLGWHS